jgi:hypothetical protein
MSTNPDPQEAHDELLKIFATKFGDADGERVLDQLVIAAYQISDPGVRVGFSDAILFIMRNRRRGKELAKPPSVKGRARLALGTQETGEE